MSVEGESRNEGEKIGPPIVTLSVVGRVPPPPLKLEVEECVEEKSPGHVWQVYALGGFMVARWIWSRWKERKANSGSSGLGESSAQDTSSSI